MQIKVITFPESIPNEVDHLCNLFNAGLETLHLRKDDNNKNGLEDTLRKLPSRFYNRIMIHGNYSLIEKYNLKGIHLTSWFMKNMDEEKLKTIITTAHKRRLTVSGSFHSIKELEYLRLKLNYVFLGPVFNSISKKGYASAIDIATASTFLKKNRSFKVMALGGIDENNILQIKNAGFDGAALLGAVWNNNDPSAEFQKIKDMAA